LIGRGGIIGPRWYCVQFNHRRETEGFERLWRAGFEPFVPLTPKEVRHARRTEIVLAPLFGPYGFVRMDLRRPGWQRIFFMPGVKRIFCAGPERPSPMPVGLVEALRQQEAHGAKRDPRATFRRFAKDSVLRITGDGPWTDHRGVCLVDEGKRVKLLLTVLGAQRRVTVPRSMVVQENEEKVDAEA
jgi:transcriptional antiterminator RfaH